MPFLDSEASRPFESKSVKCCAVTVSIKLHTMTVWPSTAALLRSGHTMQVALDAAATEDTVRGLKANVETTTLGQVG